MSISHIFINVVFFFGLPFTTGIFYAAARAKGNDSFWITEALPVCVFLISLIILEVVLFKEKRKQVGTAIADDLKRHEVYEVVNITKIQEKKFLALLCHRDGEVRLYQLSESPPPFFKVGADKKFIPLPKPETV